MGDFVEKISISGTNDWRYTWQSNFRMIWGKEDSTNNRRAIRHLKINE